MKKLLFILGVVFLSIVSVNATTEITINNNTPNKLKIEWNVEEGKTYNVYSCASEEVSTCELVTNVEEGSYEAEITDFTKKYYYAVTSCTLIEGDEPQIVCDEVETVASLYAKTKITDYNITTVNATSMKVSWDEVPGAYYYEVKYKLLGDESWIIEKSTDDVETIFDNLKTNGTYVVSLSPVFRIDEENYESFATEKEFNMNFAIGNVSAKNINVTSIRLTIDKVENANGYDIYKSTNNKTFKKLATTTKLTYDDKKLTTGTRYYYKVRAYTTIAGKKIYTGYSKVVSAIPSVVAPKFTVSVKTYNSTLIRISKVSGAKGYVIYRSTNKDTGYKAITTTTKTTFEDKKLNPGTTYYYKVKGYSLKGKKKIFGTLSGASEFYLDLQLPHLSYNNPNRDSLEIIANGAKGVEGYEVTLLDGEEVVGTKEGTKVIFDNLEYGKNYKVKAVSYKTLNDERIKSDEVFMDAQVKPIKPVVRMDTQYFYNLQFIYATINDLEVGDDVVVTLYRSTSENGSYSQVGDPYQFTNNSSLTSTQEDEYGDETTVNGPFSSYEVLLISDSLKLQTRYYYRVSVAVNGVESKYATVNKVSVAKPEMGLIQRENKKLMFAAIFPSIDDNDTIYYELWRSTKKKGKYTRILNKALSPSSDYTVFANISADFNKTYYYKMRYYKIYNGKKVYSGYSNIISYKSTLRNLYKFPVYLESNAYSVLHDMTVKSLGFSIKRTSGNNVYYNMKINFKSTYAKSKVKSTFWMTFYDWDGYTVASVPVTVTLPKGTKKNWSKTVTIRVPKTAVYYEFD